ncbi:MAG: leucine-rich repeat protein, partial [Oscillospiraceae bacterium]|nr:leucine-rich repeat protein [Oscillospiraceae bacterium]
HIEKVIISDGITEIGANSFSECSKMTSVQIPDTVTRIGDYAFDYCRSLKSVTIPNSVMRIGVSAFGDCFDLNAVIIPASVTRINEGAFSNCVKITFEGKEPPVIAEYLSVRQQVEIRVPRGAKESYRTVGELKKTKYIISEYVQPYSKGDVLGNGTISVNDALEILKYLAKLPSEIEVTPDSLKAACITGEETPTINDALEILKCLAKLESLIDN